MRRTAGSASMLWRLLPALLLASNSPVGATEQPLVLVLALDTSGSLGAEARAARGRLVGEILGALPAEAELAVFSFNDESALVVPRTANRGVVERAARSLGPAGRFTALHDAIYDASQYLAQGPSGRRAVLLVTDGLDENSALTLEDGVDQARQIGIPVFAIGVGRVRGQVLRRIAKLTGGEYFSGNADGSLIASHIQSATLAAPQPLGSPLPAAPPTSEGLDRPVTLWSRSPLAVALGWGLVAALTLAAFASLAFALRRREPALATPLREPASEPEAAGEDGFGTLVTRREGLEEPSSPTMVLTLKPLLHVTRGADSGRFFEVSLSSAVSVGRAEGNDIVLRDPAVSGQHCRVRPSQDGGFELLDLQSTNGTWVNEKRIARHPLAAGDTIKVGETVMQFRMDHLKSQESSASPPTRR